MAAAAVCVGGMPESTSFINSERRQKLQELETSWARLQHIYNDLELRHLAIEHAIEELEEVDAMSTDLYAGVL